MNTGAPAVGFVAAYDMRGRWYDILAARILAPMMAGSRKTAYLAPMECSASVAAL